MFRQGTCTLKTEVVAHSFSFLTFFLSFLKNVLLYITLRMCLNIYNETEDVIIPDILAINMLTFNKQEWLSISVLLLNM